MKCIEFIENRSDGPIKGSACGRPFVFCECSVDRGCWGGIMRAYEGCFRSFLSFVELMCDL